MSEQQSTPNKDLLQRFLGTLETAGNKLPDPVTLFFVLCVAIIFISHFIASMGVSVVHPSTHKVVNAVSLLTRENLQQVLGKVVANFQGFPPLGLVLVTMIGVGVAERTGLMESAMKQSLTKVSPRVVTLLIILIGICANAAGDAGFIVLPPLAASIYMALGRHPLAGMFVAYGSIAAGFSANLIVNMLDVLITGFTIPAAQVVDPNYNASPAMNFYFLFASTFVLTIVGYFVNEKIVEPRLGTFDASESLVTSDSLNEAITEKESRGLRNALITLVIYVAIVIALCIGDNPFMADPATKMILNFKSTLMQGMVPLVLLMFLIPGLAYGLTTGSIKNDKDVVRMMGESMSSMGSYIVLAFIAAQFLAYFNWSNLGLIIAVKGAEFLTTAGFTGVALILAFTVLSAFVNLFIGSGSAKWAIMAPVFVPMFLLVGYDPALTQIAYRIGDSLTNPISPLFPYFPVLVAFAQRYVPKCGIGTIIANMLPYTVAFAIIWSIILTGFIVFNLPLGPDGGIYYQIK